MAELILEIQQQKRLCYEWNYSFLENIQLFAHNIYPSRTEGVH